jgi:TolB protein
LRLIVLVCLTLLLAGCSGEEDGTVSASGGELIAFASSRDGDFDIYTMRPDVSEVQQLIDDKATAESEVDEARPLWSPDGGWIAFMSTRDHSGDGAEQNEVYVMRADGSEQRRLTDNQLVDLVSGWSAAGEIVFWQCREGIAGCELRVIGRDGGGEQPVFDTEDAVVNSLGPDGDNEVFATIVSRASGTGSGGQTFAIDVRSGDSRRVADRGLRSPDGEHVLIETDRDKNGPCLFHDCTGHAPELYVDDRRLTRTTGEEGDAVWSPGGKRILFARIANDDGDDYELWVMNADGTCETQLTDNGDWDWSPDWYGSAEDDAPLEC